MNLCDVCGNQFPAELISCPVCKGVIGGFLSKSLTGHRDMRKVALETIHTLEERWAFNSFAPGWRMVDIGSRLLIVIVLVVVAFSMSQSTKDRVLAARLTLETHKIRVEQAASSDNAELRELSHDYSNLAVSTDNMITALSWNGELHVALILALLALIAVSATGSYRQFKELNRVKATLRFLCTGEGRAFVGEILVQLASEHLRDSGQLIDTPPAAAPPEGTAPEETAPEEKAPEEKAPQEEAPVEKAEKTEET